VTATASDPPGLWIGYRADLSATLRMWRTSPAVPTMSLLVAVALEGPFVASRVASKGWALLALPVELGLAGWVGTQRLWYLRISRGRPISNRDLLRATGSLLGRFVALGLIVGVPTGIIAGVLAVAIPAGRLVFLAAAMFIVDVGLTFAPPALCFTTNAPVDALRQGWRLLRASWPGCAFYALTPPLTLFVLTQTVAGKTTALAIATGILGVAASMLGLWLKGPIVLFYLRRVAVTGDGCVFDSPKPTPRRQPPRRNGRRSFIGEMRRLG